MAAARTPVGMMCGAPAFDSGPAAFPKRRPGGLSLAAGWVTVQYVKDPGAMVQDAYRRHKWYQTMKGASIDDRGGRPQEVWEWATPLQNSAGLYLGVYPGPEPTEKRMTRIPVADREDVDDADVTWGEEFIELPDDSMDSTADTEVRINPRSRSLARQGPQMTPLATRTPARQPPITSTPGPGQQLPPIAAHFSTPPGDAPRSGRASIITKPEGKQVPTTYAWTPSVTPYQMADTTYGRALNALRCAETALDVMHHACMDMYARYASFPDTRPVHLDFTLRNIVAKTVCYDDVWQTPKFGGVSMIDFDLLAKIRVVVGEGQAGMVPLDADTYWRVTLACNLRHYEIEVRRFRARLNEARKKVVGVQRRGMIIGAMYADRIERSPETRRTAAVASPAAEDEGAETTNAPRDMSVVMEALSKTYEENPLKSAAYAWAEHGLHVSNAVLGAARQLSAVVLADTETLYTVELPGDPHFGHKLTLAELCRAIRV